MEEVKQLFFRIKELGIDPAFFIRESFLGYKYRKMTKTLYTEDALVPTKLIRAYYSYFRDNIDYDNIKSSFITHYIKNESKLEGINENTEHGKEEMQGLGAMYDYIHSDDIDYMFNIYTLKELHEKLYSFAPNPDFGGTFRNYPVYLPGTGTELCDYRYIRYELNNLDSEVIRLHELAPKIKENGTADDLLNYLDECVELKCKLIKIHPFGDGNGRSVRGFINKLFEDAGLPPVYIKEKEKKEYHIAMNKANNEGDYSLIKGFYKYKVCDSLIELDINEKLRKHEEKSKRKNKRKRK